MTKFKEKWLNQLDINGMKVALWCEKSKHDEESTLCRICNSTFKIDRGFDKVNQHAKGKTHIKKVGVKDNTQLRLINQPQNESDSIKITILIL